MITYREWLTLSPVKQTEIYFQKNGLSYQSQARWVNDWRKALHEFGQSLPN